MPKTIKVCGMTWSCPECQTENKIVYTQCMECDTEFEVISIKSEKLEIAIQALQDIVDPIAAIRRDLKDDEQIDGRAAVELARNSEYLREIAKKALDRLV